MQGKKSFWLVVKWTLKSPHVRHLAANNILIISRTLDLDCSAFHKNFIQCVPHHRFRWYATLENKTSAGTFPNFPSILRVIDMSDQNPNNHSPLAWCREGHKVTLMVVIGGFWSDLSITRKTEENFGNVFLGCFVFQSRVSTKTVVKCTYW